MKSLGGKTKVRLCGSPPQTQLRQDDLGYIDGYVRGANDVPLAVFVRLYDGLIDLVPINTLLAVK